MKSETKLSQVIKELAEKMFSKPNLIPSLEAAQAAILFAHAGWNRALGYPLDGYERILASLEIERPNLWRELKSRNAEDLIAFAATEKRRLWANDRRVIIVCGFLDEKIHVEWCYESEYEAAKKQIEDIVRNLPSRLRRIGA